MSISPEDVVTYEEWGVAFFQHAVSEQRLVEPITALAGGEIEVGPMKVGPGRLAKVLAHVTIGQPVATRQNDVPVEYLVRLPVDVAFDLNLQVATNHYTARLDIPIVVRAVAGAPLKVLIEIDVPEPRDIGIDLQGTGLTANVVKEVADIKGEIRRFVTKYIRREIEKPHILAVRSIDVLTLIDGALATTLAAEPAG